jgi:hypothetical protein
MSSQHFDLVRLFGTAFGRPVPGPAVPAGGSTAARQAAEVAEARARWEAECRAAQLQPRPPRQAPPAAAPVHRPAAAPADGAAPARGGLVRPSRA